MGNKMQNARNMEEKVADLLDGEQSEGPSSRSGVPDVLTEDLVVECKHRKALPKWLKESILQAVQYRQEYRDKLPAAVLHQKHFKHSDNFVTMPLWAFKKILEG